MELAISSPGKAETTGAVEVSDLAFAQEYNQDLVHQIVTAYLAGARQGTRAQKNRAAVSGGGKKPWRQKGTGRARAGTIRSPIWRGGGITFAAQPQDHSQKVNKKMYRAALRSIFSELARQGRLMVVEEFTLAESKTKLMVAALADLGLTRALIVAEDVTEGLYLAARNLHGVSVVDAAGVDPVSLVGSDKVVITVSSLKKIEELLA